MAYRTTEAAVKLIISVDSVTIPDISPFIETANNLVTQVCSDSSYSAATLELIERWLSAHFYAIRDPRYSSETAGPVGVSYQQSVGLNLQNTSYGQQAMMIDTAGSLTKLSKGSGKLTVGTTWLGTDLTPDDDTTP